MTVYIFKIFLQMGVDVIIKNSNPQGKELTIQDIIIPDMRFGTLDDAYRLRENVLGNYLVVCNREHICRGHEIIFEIDKTIHLTLNLPTSVNDITYFYHHIKCICQMLQTEQFIRDDIESSFEQINSFIEYDTNASIDALRDMQNKIDSGTYTTMIIYGVLHPVVFGKDEIDEINGDIAKFGQVMNDFYMQDIYYPKTFLYSAKEGKPFGAISITEGVLTAFPKDPQPLLSQIKISHAYVTFTSNNTILGHILFDNFIENVDKSQKYDADHFIITLNISQINELLSKFGTNISPMV